MLTWIVPAVLRPEVDPAVGIVKVILTCRKRLSAYAAMQVRFIVVEKIFREVAA
jgi:hypothetical protein